MHMRSFVASAALLVAALGCRDDPTSPTDPAATRAEPAVSSAATALAFSQVSASGHTCGVTTDYHAYCWGSNRYGQLGVGTNAGPEDCGNPCSTRPVAVLGGLRFRQISAGGVHTCAVSTTYRAYCWGQNTSGQLGDGTTTDRLTPVLVAGGHQFRQVDAGGTHTCAVTYSDNRAYCWGWNRDGELGNGTTTNRLTPVLVAGGRQYRQLDAGDDHTCGVSTSGVAFCWGRNRWGQLGDSTTITRLSPRRVVGARQWKVVSAGYEYTCGVTATSRAFCWGYGKYGQIGDGKYYARLWPRAVAGGLYFSRVTAGTGWAPHTCGEATGSRAYCWGGNYSGELGNGTIGNTLSTPRAVAGGLYFKQVSAGWTHTCGKTDLAVAYCWGSNTLGEVGDGTTETRTKPTVVIAP